MKQCKRCGSNGPFGKNRLTYDGLQSWCKMCKKDSNLNADYASINRRRRSNPEYRERERKRAAELDKIRRKVDKIYSIKRFEQWKNTVKPESIAASRTAHNKRRRESNAAIRALRTPEDIAAAKKRQADGFKRWNRNKF